MMIRTTAAAAMGCLLLGGTASAQQNGIAQGLYVGGSLNYAYFWEINDAEYDLLGFGLSALAGLQMLPNVRLEGELGYETADFDDVNVETEVTRGTVSAYYDLGSRAQIASGDLVPYVGLGAGLANIDFGAVDDNELTIHGEAGATMIIGDNLEFVPGLRLEIIPLDDGDDQWITQLRAGLRYRL